jgi:hypothetical protein
MRAVVESASRATCHARVRRGAQPSQRLIIIIVIIIISIVIIIIITTTTTTTTAYVCDGGLSRRCRAKRVC